MKPQNDTNFQREQSIDLYKGICVLFVIIHHYTWDDSQTLILMFPFWVYMAVPIFLVITGWLSAKRFSEKKLTFLQMYNPKEMLPKWARLILPAIPVLLLQLPIKIFVLQEKETIVDIVKWYLLAGFGPGSYYIFFMLQAVLILPVLWILISQKPHFGLIICFSVNVFYEMIKGILNVPNGFYRLFILRNLFILSYGVFLYVTKEEKKKSSSFLLGILGGFGFIYIIVFNYFGMEPLFTKWWTVTSVFAVLLILPLMKLLLKTKKLHNKWLELLGKASYEIFLIQMFYYWFLAEYVYQIIPTIILQLIVSITICCIGGLIYYKLESPISSIVVKRIRESKIIA